MTQLETILQNQQHKRGSLSVHDTITREVYCRAMESHPNAKVYMNYEWQQGTKSGEVDVLVEYPDRYIFYEIKSCNRIRKAQKQYNRFKIYYAKKEVKGVYISPYDVVRLR